MVEVHPDITDIRSSLAQGHENLGRLLKETGRLTQADAEYRAALAIRRELADRNPAVPSHRADLASVHTYLADLSGSLGRPAEARDSYDRAIALRERLVQEAPNSASYRSQLASSLRRRGLASADARRALGLYDGLASRSGDEWFETACCHAALSALAGRGGVGASAAEREEEAARAMRLLSQAVGMGCRDANAFRTEPALDPLRDRADFRILMMDLAFPAEPFAAAH
jgi:tetratricopeptide (TPR) repeat protein